MLKKNIIKLEEKPVSAQSYFKLHKLFIYKQWDIENDNNLSVFNRYYSTLKILDQKQQDLFIDLSRKFIHIPNEKYLEKIIPSLTNLINDCVGETLYFAPCLPERDLGKIKSSTSVLYLLKGSTLKTRIDFKDIKYCICENVSNLKFNKHDFKIILVDDFIGTGETASSAIEYVMKTLKIDCNHIKILSIAAHNIGIKRIEQLGIKLYYSIMVKKGITDLCECQKKEDAKITMEQIEQKISKLREEFKFGYGKCEALISLERCPNNTFPIYWRLKNISPYER